MKKTLSILLIEDDMIEVMKMQRIITKSNLPHKIIEAKNGQEALDYLRGDNSPTRYHFFRSQYAAYEWN